MHRVLQRLTIKYQACEADNGWRIGTPEAVLYHIYAGMCSDISGLEPAIEPVAPCPPITAPIIDATQLAASAEGLKE